VRIGQIKDWFEMPVGGEKTVRSLMYDNWLLSQYGKPMVKIPAPQELRNKKAGVAIAPRAIKRHGPYAIRQATPIKPFWLMVDFWSGESRMVDVHAMFKGNRMFARLWEWDEFKKLRLEPNTVLWYHGLEELEVEDQDLWAFGEPI